MVNYKYPNRHRLRWLAILFLLFASSVVIRLPFLNRPLDGHHEWITAHAIITHSIWYERGIASCGFNPITSFSLPADKNILGPIGKMVAPNGDSYYISQPPFAYILPYFVITSLGFHPGVLPIQIFNLAIHLICIVLLFLTIWNLAVYRNVRRPGIPSLAGAAVYAFMPATLWFHSNVYSLEMLVQVFFILGIYLFTLMLTQPARPVWLYVALATTAFCMTYTEWIGVFFAFAIALYALFHFRDRMARWTFVIVAVGSAAALCLTFTQYSRIAGIDEFLRCAKVVYLERSGLSSNVSPPNRILSSFKAWQYLGRHYFNGFGWFPFVLTFAFAATAFGKFLKDKTSRFTKIELTVMFLLLLPIILHHLCFFNFTVIHDYSVMKDAVFFSMLTGILCYLFMSLPNGSTIISTRWKLLNTVLAAAFVCSLLFGIDRFWKINRDSPNSFKETGELIARTAKPDEVVFAIMEELCPQVVFYAHRNIASFHSEQLARDLIRKNHARRGIIFTIDYDGQCTAFRYLE